MGTGKFQLCAVAGEDKEGYCEACIDISRPPVEREGFQLWHCNHQILHALVCESWWASVQQEAFPVDE